MDKVRLEIRERIQDFIDRLRARSADRLPGTAVVLGRMAKGVPLALSHNVNCNRVLHEQVLLVAANDDRNARCDGRGSRSWSLRSPRASPALELRYGFMEEPNVPERSREAMASGRIETFDPQPRIYYTGHETIIPSGRRAGPAAMARSDVRLHASQCPAPGSVFQNPRLPDHGDRHRIRDLRPACLARAAMQSLPAAEQDRKTIRRDFE